MRAHLIQDGAVVNTIEVDSLDFIPGLIDADVHGGGIGDRWDGQQVLPREVVIDPAQVMADTLVAIQNLLDTTAQSHGYDNIVSVISYVGSSRPKWNAEGLRAKAWRDDCWAKAEEIKDAVLAGSIPLPSVAEVLAQMPPANWPEAA